MINNKSFLITLVYILYLVTNTYNIYCADKSIKHLTLSSNTNTILDALCIFYKTKLISNNPEENNYFINSLSAKDYDTYILQEKDSLSVLAAMLTSKEPSLKHIEFFAVDPEHQRKGFGAKLLSEFLRLEENNNTLIFLQTSHKCYPGSPYLYANAGFNYVPRNMIEKYKGVTELDEEHLKEFESSTYKTIEDNVLFLKSKDSQNIGLLCLKRQNK